MTLKAWPSPKPSPWIYRAYLPPKPVSSKRLLRPVRLPRLTWYRRLIRGGIRLLTRALRYVLTETHVEGLENLPKHGPAILVTNHLGDADVVLLLSVLPWCPETLAALELRDIWWIRLLFDLYGVIWVHRGTPDRKALHVALQALKEGRIVGLAPEGRQSLIGGLEPGTPGVAFLALKSRAPVIPVALTGTENWYVFPRLKRLKRLHMTVRVGKPFIPEVPGEINRREALDAVTEQIMRALAALLPPDYQGVYRETPCPSKPFPEHQIWE